MALVRPNSIQKHPIAWGLLWAAGTLALIYLYEYMRGERSPSLFISVPIFALGGVSWGYAMKRHFDRKAASR